MVERRLHLLGVDEWSDHRVGLVWITNLQPARAFNESFDKAIIERSVDNDPVGAHADLALGWESSDDRTRDGPIQISIVEHDAGRVAAKLQCHALERCALYRQFTDAPSDPCRSRKRNEFRHVMKRKGIANLADFATTTLSRPGGRPASS